MTSFEATNSVFNKTDENNSFSIIIPSQWETKSSEKTINELNELLGFRSQNGIELHVEQVGIRGTILINVYSLSSFGTFKNEIFEELRKVKDNDLEDQLYIF